jgi:hypothetical protein
MQATLLVFDHPRDHALGRENPGRGRKRQNENGQQSLAILHESPLAHAIPPSP